VVLDVCRVRIGGFTLFGPAVQIYTPLHPLDAGRRRQQEFGKPVEIGADVWVPAGVFAAGNPCRVIRALEQGT
jgi:maltose O-acetyltransferase